MVNTYKPPIPNTEPVTAPGEPADQVAQEAEREPKYKPSKPNQRTRFARDLSWRIKDMPFATLTPQKGLWKFSLAIPAGEGRETVYRALGATPREAYRNADRARRIAAHDVQTLLRQKAELRRDVDKLDDTNTRLIEELVMLTFAKRLDFDTDTARAERARALLTARRRGPAHTKTAAAAAIIAQQDAKNADLLTGLHEIRLALDDAGITAGNLVDRIHALAAQRDALRAEVNQARQARQEAESATND